MSRKRADWMWQVDDRILETLQKLGPITLNGLLSRVLYEACDAPIHRADIASRVEKLDQYNLVSRDNANLVYLSSFGQAYLNGDLDVRSLEPTPTAASNRRQPQLPKGRMGNQ